MTRIVIDPGELAETASFLRSASSGYEAIGARVASCDCGCMPDDVAGTVDETLAAIRARLRDTSAVMAGHASDLDWRAGMPQDGGFTAVGSAFGFGSFVDRGAGTGGTFAVGGTGFDAAFSAGPASGAFVVGGTGFDASFLEAGAGGGTFTIGGAGSSPSFSSAPGGSTFAVGGTGFDPAFLGGGGGGGAFTVGGTGPPIGAGGGGGTFVLGGTDVPLGAGGGGGTFVLGGTDLPLGGGGGGGVALVGGADPNLVATMEAQSASTSDLWAAAARYPLLPGLINGILAPSQARMAAIWTTSPP